MSSQLLCNTCSKAITSEYVNLGEERNYHPECFNCSTCKKSLAGEQYYEMENELYCENDYHKKFSPSCGGCQQTILDEYIEVMGLNYHKNCFVCCGCKKIFGDLQFFKHNGDPFCAECYGNKAPKCHTCGKAIIEKTYSALNKNFHLECFVCPVCSKGFDKGAFVPYEDKPYHQECYRAKFGKNCGICTKDITAEYFELEGAPIHKDCYEKFKTLSAEDKKKLREELGKSSNTTSASTTIKTTTTTTKPTSLDTKTVEEMKQTKDTTSAPQKHAETSSSSTKPEEKKENKIEIKAEVSVDKLGNPILKTNIIAPQTIEGISSTAQKEGSPSGSVYPYELLTKAPFPAGVDPSKREQYLSYSEFERIFKITWNEFQGLTKWKQNEAKKKFKLF